MSHHKEEDSLLIHPDTADVTPTPTPTAPSSVGCCGRVCGVVKGITVEPVLFLFVVSMMMIASVTTNLLLDKECEEIGYSEEICGNLTTHPTEEAVVQKAVTTTTMYLSLITCLPTVTFALFFGSWSDRHGRKVPLVMPLVGELLSTLVFMANVYWMALPSAYILFTAVPVALSGGLTTLLMATFSYISDITKMNTRTTRIAFVDLGFSIGSPLGLLLGDLLYYRVGYLGVYGAGTGLFMVAITYTLVRIQDTRGRPVQENGVAGIDGEGAMTEGHAGHSVRTMCLDLFDTKNVRLSFATVLKRRPNRGRTKVLALIAAMCLLVAQFSAMRMDYLYTQRVFGWTYNQWVELAVTQLSLGVVGASVILPILSYRLQVSDMALVLAGCVSKIFAFVMFGLAPTPGFLYFSCSVGLIGGFPLIITRSLISKIVPPDELGRIFSVLASSEAIVPLAAGPLFTAVYNSSLSVLPGAIYFLNAGLFAVAGLLVLFIFFMGSSSSTSTSSNDSLTPVIHHIHADDVLDVEA